MALVQKFIVEDARKASSLLPRHIALLSPDGTPWKGGGSTEIADESITAAKIADGVIPAVPGAATASAQGLVKKASAVTDVASADAAVAAAETVTKAEFDAVVAVANETKKQFNDLLAKMKTAGQMTWVITWLTRATAH